MHVKILIFLLFFPLLGACDAQSQGSVSVSDLFIDTSGGRQVFKVEVADDPQSRSIGLMYRQHMDGDAGMLFDFKRTMPVAMWMKNTFIPLDMLFISKTGRVIYVAKRTIPHSLSAIGPKVPVYGVLEVNAGTVDRLGIKVGDKVSHPVFELSRFR